MAEDTVLDKNPSGSNQSEKSEINGSSSSKNNNDSINNDLQKLSLISDESRKSNWINVLGVRNKPDLLIDWDHLYNLSDQSELRKQCQKVISKVHGASEDKKIRVSVPDLESMMTLWCKKRKIDKVSKISWMDIMVVLIQLDFDNATLFNLFFAITTKYIPRDVGEGGKTYDLFRLLMQYHDPEVCSHLDSLKISSFSYASSWFDSLLSHDIDNQLCAMLWDIYFDKADPFLIFYISLAMVQSVREQLLEMKTKDEIISFLNDVPKNMGSEDIVDLIDVCSVSVSLTPVSIREDFHCMLFGANMVEDFYELPLHTLLCMPISVQELYKRVIDISATNTIPYNYFVVDTRSHKDFSNGSVSGSYNLSGRLLVDEPEKFQNAMNSLLQFREENCSTDHVCFFGSGLEEDDSYMMMVISRFLHKNISHISYVDGGYKALHQMLKDTNNLSKLSNHFSVNSCIHCCENSTTKESFTWSIMEGMKKRRKELTDAAKNITEYFPKPDLFSKEQQTHVKSTERNQKRYRNAQSVFSIEDSDSDDDLTVSLDSAYANEKLKWEDIISQQEITHNFVGKEVTPDKILVPCYIALSRTHMHIFHDVQDSKNYIRTSARHSLGSVMRVSSKKNYPEYLTFQFGYELPTGEAHINRVHKFIISKSGELATAVKNNIFALKPNLLD